MIKDLSSLFVEIKSIEVLLILRNSMSNKTKSLFIEVEDVDNFDIKEVINIKTDENENSSVIEYKIYTRYIEDFILKLKVEKIVP